MNPWTDAPIKCSTFLVRFWGVLWDILATRMKPLPNSSDLSLGRRPEFKSDEFGGVSQVVKELQNGENTALAVRRCSYWRRDPIKNVFSMVDLVG